MTPVPGSAVSTRSSRSAASSVPSATIDHAGVDRVADPDAAAVMHAHPRRTRCDIEQGVQDRPVGDRIGAVAHRLGLAVRRGDGARIEVVAPDHDGRFDLARAHELVDREPRARTITVPEPADAGRQSLERDALGCQLEPPLQQRVVREEVAEHCVDRRDVRRLSRERRPPKRADAATEERPDIGRDKARV